MSFEGLGLDPRLLQVLGDQGVSRPTPVQASTIPQFLSNRDVAVEACTGSGKTLAYVLPTLQILLQTKDERKGNRSDVGGLIIVPTRELAIQVHRVSCAFAKAIDFGTLLLTSGVSSMKPRQQAKKKKEDDQSSNEDALWDLVIGTPGRLDEWTERYRSHLRKLEVLIFDEADTLLGAGFHMKITNILERLPKQRRTGLFSATQAKEVQDLIRAGLRNPATIVVKVLQPGQHSQSQQEQKIQKTPNRLSNFYKVLEADEKLPFIFQFLSSTHSAKIIVFFATCAEVDYFGESILHPLVSAQKKLFTMHGKMNAKRRALTFQSFVDEENAVLMCTDVLARGIDLPDVDYIIQMDAPKEPDFFVHRVGRTARAGRLGSALLLLLPNEYPYVEYLASQKVPLDLFESPTPNDDAARFDIHEYARSLNFEDRDTLEKGTRAFVAHIAFYGEHRLSYLFRLREVDLLRLVKAFHLLRLPKLKEFREASVRRKLDSFKEVDESKVAAIRFKNPAREEKRQKLLIQGPTFNQEKKDKKPKASKSDRVQTEQGCKVAQARKRKTKQEKLNEEWDEFLREEQMFKRMRRGKISSKEYERALLDEDYED